jgi:23S rRNA (uracil1939-C5)-methyltransferase
MPLSPTPEINQILEITIDDLGTHGEGVGSHNNFRFFVDGALPGELIRIEVTSIKKNYGIGRLIEIITPSADRITPPCPYYDQCGGCQIQHLSYPGQLQIKHRRVSSAMNRIGKLNDLPISPCVASPDPFHYRNKIQLQVKKTAEGRIEFGFYARGSNEMVAVESCAIHCPIGEKVFQAIRAEFGSLPITVYDGATCEGELRHVLIKTAHNQKSVLLVFITNGAASKPIVKAAKRLMAKVPEIRGIVNNINQRRDNVILGNEYETLVGEGHIYEKLMGVEFKISPASFFQVNTPQAEAMYRKAIDLVDLKPGQTALDAYCGVGTLSMLLAKAAGERGKVIGVEVVKEAIADARENAIRNEISNVEFICGRAEELIGKVGKIDVAMVNPPRTGCEEGFLRGLVKLGPKRVVYISCDPATLARDLSVMKKLGYRAVESTPFDMFPQTMHVETVALLVADSAAGSVLK